MYSADADSALQSIRWPAYRLIVMLESIPRVRRPRILCAQLRSDRVEPGVLHVSRTFEGEQAMGRMGQEGRMDVCEAESAVADRVDVNGAGSGEGRADRAGSREGAKIRTGKAVSSPLPCIIGRYRALEGDQADIAAFVSPCCLFPP